MKFKYDCLAPAVDPTVVFLDKDSKLSGTRSSREVGEESLSKAVSENITRILEDLLKDYDKNERPSYKEGQIFQSVNTQFIFQSIRRHHPGEGEHSHQVNGTNFRNENGDVFKQNQL